MKPFTLPKWEGEETKIWGVITSPSVSRFPLGKGGKIPEKPKLTETGLKQYQGNKPLNRYRDNQIRGL
jgi:hypothetical protein